MTADHFFIAGGQRCGTSYLWRRVSAHPDIEMARPLCPEPKYFLDPAAGRAGLDRYVERFFSDGPVPLRGEKSTSYMERPEVAERILEVCPGARVVFALRDPVERAISNYWFSVRSGFETESIERAMTREEERIGNYDRHRVSVSPFAYKARGRYEELLRPWEAAFPVDRIRLILYERLVSDDAEIRGLLDFLGVAPEALPPGAPAPGRHRAEYPQPSTDLRARLVEHFREPSERLAQRWNLDLSCWASLAGPRSSEWE